MTKTEYWQQHINDLKSIDLTQVAYCLQNDIKQNTLYYWRQKLSLSANKSKQFIPVAVHSVATARVLLGTQVAIDLPVNSIADLLFTKTPIGDSHLLIEN